MLPAFAFMDASQSARMRDREREGGADSVAAAAAWVGVVVGGAVEEEEEDELLELLLLLLLEDDEDEESALARLGGGATASATEGAEAFALRFSSTSFLRASMRSSTPRDNEQKKGFPGTKAAAAATHSRVALAFPSHHPRVPPKPNPFCGKRRLTCRQERKARLRLVGSLLPSHILSPLSPPPLPSKRYALRLHNMHQCA